MTVNTENFDRWIRGSFVEMNSALEEIYFARHDRSAVEHIGDSISATHARLSGLPQVPGAAAAHPFQRRSERPHARIGW
jgi:hypothetical protein